LIRKVWILGVVCAAGLTSLARGQSTEAKQLMQATNEDRAQYGLGPLRWDPALARAAQAHAYQMVRHGELSHQYAGEPDLMTRAGHDGAHFSTVAENVAVAPTPQSVESEWMHSPHHRQNILDACLTTVGIGLGGRAITCGPWKTSPPPWSRWAPRRWNAGWSKCSQIAESDRLAQRTLRGRPALWTMASRDHARTSSCGGRLQG
jgi:hypothetical protein